MFTKALRRAFIKGEDLSPKCVTDYGYSGELLLVRSFIKRAMQFWLFLFGAVACVALSVATPVGEVKVISEEPLDGHHEIHKRQLEIVNAASDTSECIKYAW